MKKHLLFCLLALFCCSQISFSQNIQWNYKPDKGYIFEITNKEAKTLLTTTNKNKEVLFESLMYKLVDTFDVKNGWIKKPSKGHFIIAKINKNKIECSYVCISPFQVFHFKEYGFFSLQVLDKDGNVSTKAKVKINKRRVYPDNESKTYRIESSWFPGDEAIVTVEMDDFQTFHKVCKKEHSNIYNSYEDEGPAFYSYMITDKNKYKPGEKVRFKSYALSHYKFPLKEELELWLSIYSYDFKKNIKICNVSPYRPGGYTGEFYLHDSLDLRLDKTYTLKLIDRKRRIVSACSFSYEDYVLFGNKLKLELMSKHYYPENNKLKITATDVNGLLLKDARAYIKIEPLGISDIFEDLVSMDNLLYSKDIDLDPEKPTVIDIPVEIFHKANVVYKVNVVVLNTENQRIEQNQVANYYFSNYDIISNYVNDSIAFSFTYNGKELNNVKAKLTYNNSNDYKEIILPYKEKLNSSLLSYNISTDYLLKKIELQYILPEINVKSKIENDSFKVYMDNPQKIDVSWYVYQGSDLLEKGYGKEIDFKKFIEDKSRSFYVDVIFSFGGRDFIKRSKVDIKEDYLNVNIEIPDKIYPGQNVNARIHVLDYSGKAAKNVDITALAFNDMLNYYIPNLPYYGSISAPRSISDDFKMNDLYENRAILKLNYKKWQKLAHLDTMKYYQFSYPHGMFIYKTDIANSTQFAPFVMEDGEAREIYVIEVNHKPVYFSWTNHPQGYSFEVSDSKKVQISLRLSDRVIILDSMKFEKNKKTIISLDCNNPANAKVMKLNEYFSSTEQSRYLSYISAFKITSIIDNYAYLKNDSMFIAIAGRNYKLSGSYIIAGPIENGYILYVGKGENPIFYFHENNYLYNYAGNVVYKLSPPSLLPKKLNNNRYDPLNVINDITLTEEQFIKYCNKKIFNPKGLNVKTIELQNYNLGFKIFLPEKLDNSPLISVIFEKDSLNKTSFLWYNYEEVFNKELLTDGIYNIILVYKDGCYARVDSIRIKNNTYNSFNFRNVKIVPADLYSQNYINELTDLYYYKYHLHNVRYFEENSSNQSRVFELYNKKYGNVEGKVTDLNNEPLPGATIVVKNTNIGAIADLEGNFSINIPDYSDILEISYIGYEPLEIEVTQGSFIEAKLEESVLNLEEVVVIGYGVNTKSELTGSVASISTVKAQKDDISDNIDEENDIIKESQQKLYQELLNINTIRSNFSDVGFWEPKLFTDRKGVADFNVTFPDNITKWNVVVYAMNRFAQTGTARKDILSYKPIMAELHLPQFLTLGDSVNLIGKILNYSGDSILKGKVKWEIPSITKETDVTLHDYYTSKIPFIVSSLDTATFKYIFTRDDGYFDGEERKLPINDQGIIRADGELGILKNGDSLRIKTSPEYEKETFEILDNQIDIYAYDAYYLSNYRYLCNEQLASKLIGLINSKLLSQYYGKKFHNEKEINKIIKKLINNESPPKSIFKKNGNF
jgi:hypothetical protein